MATPAPDISPRHHFEARVSISVERGEQKINLQGWVRDLSESELRAFVADPLLLGESVISSSRYPILARSFRPKSCAHLEATMVSGSPPSVQISVIRFRPRCGNLHSSHDRRVELSGRSRASVLGEPSSFDLMMSESRCFNNWFARRLVLFGPIRISNPFVAFVELLSGVRRTFFVRYGAAFVRP